MTKHAPLPSQEVLRKAFFYDPDTGFFHRLKSTAACRPIGSRMDYDNTKGYRVAFVAGRQLRCNRLAWRYMTSHDPGPLVVDHINGVTDDNRWSNLRLLTIASNALHRVARPAPSGLPLGVARTRSGKFEARIVIDRKRIGLGHYETPEAAARCVAMADAHLRDRRCVAGQRPVLGATHLQPQGPAAVVPSRPEE